MRHDLPSPGFTLVETLISTAILVLIMAALFNVYKGYNSVFVIQQAHVDVHGSAREVADEFKATAAQASRVELSHTFSATTYSSDSSTAVFQVPSIDASGFVIDGVYDYVVFYATSTDVYKMTELGSGSSRTGGTRKLSSTLYSLTFSYNNANVAVATSTSVDIQTEAVARGETIHAHVQETARLRNL